MRLYEGERELSRFFWPLFSRAGFPGWRRQSRSFAITPRSCDAAWPSAEDGFRYSN